MLPRPLHLVFAVFLFPVITLAQSDDRPSAVRDRVWRVGIYDDAFPYTYRTAPDEPLSGFAVDIWAGVQEISDLPVEIVSGSTRELQEQFHAGEIDILLSYAYSEERAERFDFSASYLDLNGAVFGRPELADLRDLHDLAGHRVLVHPGSLGERVLQISGLDNSIVHVDSVIAALQHIDAAEGDATLAARLSAISVIERDGLNLVRLPIEVPNYTVFYCFAVHKGERELLARLNEALAVLHRTDRYDPIYRKWFGRFDPVTFSVEQVLAAVAGGLFLALVAAIAIAVYQRRLRHHLAREQAARSATEAHFREVFDATPVALIVAEVQSVSAGQPILHMRDANPAAERLFGWSQPRPGSPLQDLAPNFAALWRDASGIRANTSPRPRELALNPGDKRSLHLRWSAVREAHRILLVVENVTAQVRAQAELQATEHALLQTQKLDALGTLASGIAHDFNNVLTGILGHAELLKLDLADRADTVGAPLDAIVAGARRARDLVRQILTFSRQTEPAQRHLDLRPIVRETLQLLRAASPRAIALQLDEPVEAAEVWADGTQIHQVLMNVCTNAIQAIGDRPGRVLVNLLRQEIAPGQTAAAVTGMLPAGRYWCIDVSDNGSGIPDAIRARIFDPFFTTKRNQQGTGLGLATAHGIVQRHLGAITVHPVSPHGTRMRIWLPENPAGAFAAGEETIAEFTGFTDKPRILVIDDETAVAQAFAPILRRLGCDPVVHISARQALIEFDRTPADFAAVLCDLSMPEASGLDVLQHLLARRPDLPVMLMSGFWPNGSRQKARDRGARIVADKPIGLLELRDYLQRLLGEEASASPPQ